MNFVGNTASTSPNRSCHAGAFGWQCASIPSRCAI
jgi:hypothetical protein